MSTLEDKLVGSIEKPAAKKPAAKKPAAKKPAAKKVNSVEHPRRIWPD